MRISVIISCYNCAKTLPAQLEALSGQIWDDDWEVIVADNGSTDRSVSIVKRFKDSLPSIRVIHATRSRGYAHARNAAAKEAHGEAFLFCDGNDIVNSNWLTAMGNALREKAFVAGRLVVTEINEEWAVRSRPEGMDLQNQGVLTTFGYLPWASSSNMGIQRDLFNQVGGFNESLSALEDIDFCWRVQQVNETLVPVSDSFVHYRLRKTYVGIFHQALLYAEDFVFLCKRYKPHGFSPPLPSIVSLAENWTHLALQLIRFQKKDRGVWVWNLGWRCGCISGSLKHRLFVP